MEKLVRIDDKEFEKPAWITDIGGQNQLPEPHEEVSEKEFWNYFAIWPILYMDRRYVPFEEHLCRTLIFWSVREAYAIVFQRRKQESLVPQGPSPSLYVDVPCYYLIGCRHEWGPDLSKKQYMFEHHMVCTKCGTTWSYDSSG